MDITKLYKTQISLTEWLEKVNHKSTDELRKEDNDKRERLKILHQHIGLPFDRPFQFSATDIKNSTPSFIEFLSEHGNELCALRLIPFDSKLPKLRMRGHTVRDAVQWFDEQHIDVNKYKADFVPHSEKNVWSTIFIVNNHGIFGEIIAGGHHQLTQGFYDTETSPITFSFDWKTWTLSEENEPACKELHTITRYLYVADQDRQKTLEKTVQATFAHNYIKGYFETVTTSEFGLWFIDYNRLLGNLYEDVVVPKTSFAKLSEEGITSLEGQVGSKGVARGTVHIVLADDVSKISRMNEGEVLVCEMTTPEYIQLMQSSCGVVTDLGGILSHAAIICRELRKPCVVGTKNATKILQDGDLV